MILVDGIADGAVPADDRGLAYGDGVFETMRIAAGGVPWLERHLARLASSCRELGFEAPEVGAMRDDVARLAHGVERGVAKLVVTRGSGGRGYAAPSDAAPRRIASRHPFPDHPPSRWSEGIRARWCATRIAARAPLAGIKHLNRLPQVMARREWDDRDIAEGLLLDTDGAVVEATSSNLFLIMRNKLVTPRIEGGAVAGLARAFVMEHAGSLALEVEERVVRRPELDAADELFLCNAVVGVWPVRELEGRVFPVGPASLRVQAMLAAEGLGP